MTSFKKIAAIGSILVVGLVIVNAQAPQPPYALFQNATLTSSTNALNATRVPVVTQGGAVVYVDMKLQFNSDANGNVTIAQGYPQFTPSISLLTSNFKAGTYGGPSTLLSGKAVIAVNGPGVADGGATLWSLSSGAGADQCTTPIMAAWYDGPISSSPYAARLKTAGITSTAWSYGVGGGTTCGTTVAGLSALAWHTGSLLGLSQTGNTLTIASFSLEGSQDYNVPQDQIIYTIQP